MANEQQDLHRPLKDVFGRFATGIAIASCNDAEGNRVAITVNSFTSVSLTPALVSWCIDKNASTFESFMASDSYAISILRGDQRAISDQFAGFSDEDTPWPPTREVETGSPLLETCLAALDCKIYARHDAGDHIILIGEVVWYQSYDGAPLVYFASQYGIGPASSSDQG